VTVTKQNYLPALNTAQVLPSNLPPYQPHSPLPANTTLDVPLSITLSWEGGDPDPGDTVTYDVSFGTTTTPPIVSSNQSQVSYTSGPLYTNTLYYWRITAWDNHGASTTGPLWCFTTTRDLLLIKNLSISWNFISLPFNQSLEKQNLSIIHNTVLYSWQEAVNQSLIVDFIFGWNRTDQTYEIVDLLIPGQGYWMYTYDDCTLTAENINVSPPDAYITRLLQTWSLIGSPGDEPIQKQDLLIRYQSILYTWQEAVDNSIVLNFLYEWNDTIQAYGLTNVLQPGRSYWMYAYQDCTLLRPLT
jgi:hypothetical protein